MEAPPTDFDDAAVAVAAAWADSITADAPAWAMDADHEEAATVGDAHTPPDAMQHGHAAGGGATEGAASSFLEAPAPVANDAAGGLAWPSLALRQEPDMAGGNGADGLVSYHATEWPVGAPRGDLDRHAPITTAETEATHLGHEDDAGAHDVPSAGAQEPAASPPAAPVAQAEADAANSDSAATDSDSRKPSFASQRRKARTAWTHKKHRRTSVSASTESEEEEAEEDEDEDKDEEDPNILYCICRKPYDKNKFMVQCDKCEDWYGPFQRRRGRCHAAQDTDLSSSWVGSVLATRFHTRCVGITSYEAKRADFYVCPPCKTELKGTTSYTCYDARADGLYAVRLTSILTNSNVAPAMTSGP